MKIGNISPQPKIIKNVENNIQNPRRRSIFERLDVNMKTEIGYKGEPEYTPAPETLGKYGELLRNLNVNWATHVNEYTRRSNL